MTIRWSCFTNAVQELKARKIFGTYVHQIVLPLVDYFEQFAKTLEGHFLELKEQVNSLVVETKIHNLEPSIFIISFFYFF